MKVAICFALVAVCAAQVPLPCSSPSQWEGRRYRTEAGKEFSEISMYTYDEVNMRTRSIEEIRQGTERDFFDVLHLHNVGKEYRLDLRTRKCNVTDLTRPFFKKGVPPGSTFRGEAEVGPVQLANEHFTIQFWDITFPVDNATYAIGVTSPDCVPVFSSYSNKGANLFENEQFFDIHAGITDPSVFIPPTECQ